MPRETPARAWGFGAWEPGALCGVCPGGDFLRDVCCCRGVGPRAGHHEEEWGSGRIRGDLGLGPSFSTFVLMLSTLGACFLLP